MKIHLDMDGLVANCADAICVRHERPIPYTGNYWMNREWGMTSGQVWSKCSDESFWYYIQKTKEADRIIELMEGKNWRFLSSTPSDKNAARHAFKGKSMWVNKFYPQHHHRLTVATNDKAFYSGPGHLLIDDFDYNVETWRDAGGKAILFPRPWNSNRHLTRDAMDYLTSTLKLLM